LRLTSRSVMAASRRGTAIKQERNGHEAEGE